MKTYLFLFFLLCATAGKAQLCPDSLQIISKIKDPVKGDTLVLEVKYKKGLGAIPTYNWSVSEASILEGQGTAIIKIASAEMDSELITVTVDLGGFGSNCSTTISETFFVRKYS